MTDKFRNKYRIPSTRLQKWDYRWNAPYFVTICTQNRECYFGDITDGKMQLSEIGKIVETEWLKTFKIRPDMNITMDEFVIMPNHFHAIIIIGKNQYNTQRTTQSTTQCITQCRDAMHCVSTAKSAKSTKPAKPTGPIEPTTTEITKNNFGPQSKNLASIIRGFKGGVTKNARQIHAGFAWQSRFHEHIIRNDKSFEKIKSYIIENPLKWNNDTFYNE